MKVFLKVVCSICFLLFCIFAWIFIPSFAKIFGGIGLLFLAYYFDKYIKLKMDYDEVRTHCRKLVEENLMLKEIYGAKPLHPLPWENKPPMSDYHEYADPPRFWEDE